VSLIRHPGRVWQVTTAFGRFAAAPGLRLGPYAGMPGPIRFRLALESLGGAWVKLGQMLAMRPDLVPVAYCDELVKLLNRVEPFGYDEVRAIVERELGAPPESIYASFEPTSFAAASIGQVHRATLHSGERVAVKVQRPGIREALQADIDLMYSLAFAFDRFRLFGATRSRTVIDEFARWTADELDYLVEARQAIVLYDQARGGRVERIARVHRAYTTSRVLTTELIEGVPLIDIVLAVRDGDGAYLDALAAAGHDRDRIVRHLDWNMLNQVYVFGTFHADLHPANLFVLPGDVIGYVDFGIVGHLPDRIRASLTRYSRLLFDGRVDTAIDELLRWLSPTPGTDPSAARRQLIRAHEAFLYETAVRGIDDDPPASDGAGLTTGGAQPAGRALATERPNPYLRLAVGILDTVRDQGLSLSGSIVAYLRMLVTLGTLRHQLAVQYDVSPTVRRFFRTQMRREGLAWLDPRLGIERLSDAGARVERALQFLEFLEDQEPLLRAASTSFLSVQGRLRAARRRLVQLGVAALLVGAGLYVVMADPDGTRAALPEGVPYPIVHLGLLAALIVLVIAIVAHMRQLGGHD
jgi:predicted unusual protein kinase regulating ubiquinone biosynthesis (AarF/ABC1/UbiB family)